MLFVNAVKYRTTQPKLKANVQQRGDQMMIEMTDNGIGISISASSAEIGTTLCLTFHINNFIYEVQG